MERRQVNNRARGRRSVALETTLLAHGVPSDSALPLAERLEAIIRQEKAWPATIGVIGGIPTAGMTPEELTALLESPDVPKVNTSNLGLIMNAGRHGATTVSTTIEIATAADIALFATGGIGGVHRDYGKHLDVSSDLLALSRFPVAVVTSGVKSLLDVVATREALETLGIPVVGFRTDAFPAFYIRGSEAGVDARMDDPAELAEFVCFELHRTGRGIVVANPVPEADEIAEDRFSKWLQQAMTEAQERGVTGRDVTPFALARLHELSDGETLRSNLALVESNARLAAQIASRL
ncbi:MAG: pseudouridine-5'-phosphate glycosidase [Phycisphaeraceae bacterium]|nr:pseudouridine-5'-phosphate glycosidase [Phycisphaeraceae bacterium]